MKILLIFVLSSLLPISAGAKSLDSVFTAKLTRAKSASEVENLEQLHLMTVVARKACRAQINSETVPFACFETLALELRWGLHDQSSKKELARPLDRLCARASAALRLSNNPENLAFLSPSCLSAVQHALRVRAYRQNRL